MVVIDELHEHKKRDLWDALTTADLARENPIVIAITTAGFDRQSVCYEQYKYGLELRESGGLEAMRKEGFLFWWYEVPMQDAAGGVIDYRDQSYWQMANPSSWITTERLERYQRRMPESVFRRLHLNQWTETEDAWIKAYEWDACRGKPKWDPGLPTWMAVDVGYRKDSAAIVWAQWHGSELHVGHHILSPQEEGPTFGIADVRGTVARWAQVMNRLEEVNYDPFQFLESAEILAERGLNMVEFPQNAARMEPASTTLYELILDRRLVHDGDPTLRAHILSAVTGPTERGGWRISKRKSLECIDGCVALAMAADRAVTMRNEKPPSGTVHIY
jgi:phage terminase large subunit-like protein